MRKYWLVALAAAFSMAAMAQGNLEIDTPAVAALKSSMQSRFPQLEPFLAAGAVGLARSGRIELRDAGIVPLAQRAQLGSLIAAENQDRAALYREIARANGHPEWEGDIARTFGERWAEKARNNWWVQDGQGAWKRK